METTDIKTLTFAHTRLSANSDVQSEVRTRDAHSLQLAGTLDKAIEQREVTAGHAKLDRRADFV